MKGRLIFLLIAVSLNTIAASDFTVCKSTYALCTTAICTPKPDNNGLVTCYCNVITGYSAATKPCQDIKQTYEGQLIYSRYYPIKSYVRCSNKRPWAWCLDSPCIIDPKDPTKAFCACSVVQDKGDYVIVTNTYDQSTCNVGLYSSALVTQLDQITNFLKQQGQLSPFPIRVYDAP